MSQLDKDIAELADEVFTKTDAWAAVKIVGEVAALGTVMYIAGVVISAMFGPAGLIPASAGAARALYIQIGKSYCELPKDQRKVVAKLCKKKNGIWDDLGFDD